MVHRVLGPLLVLIGVFWPAFAEEEQTIPILVAPGDCLISICKEHLENPQLWWKIARFNRLQTPDLILPGQIIRIPVGLLKGVPARGQVSFLRGCCVSSGGKQPMVSTRFGLWVLRATACGREKKAPIELDYNGSVQYFLRPSSELDINFSRARTPTLLTQEFSFGAVPCSQKSRKGLVPNPD